DEHPPTPTPSIHEPRDPGSRFPGQRARAHLVSRLRPQRLRELAARRGRVPLEVLQLRQGVRPHPREWPLAGAPAKPSPMEPPMRRAFGVAWILLVALARPAGAETAASDPKAIEIADQVMTTLGG